MKSSVSPARAKYTWGRRLILALVATLLVSASAEAQEQGPRAHRGPRQRSKMDPNTAVLANKLTGETNVIIEFNDETGANTLIANHGGRAGRRLGILKARTGRVPNRFLRMLANNPKVKRVSVDRPVEGLIGRTAVATGARAVQELMGYTGAGVGVAIVDSGVTSWHDDLTVANGQGQRVTHFVDFINGLTTAYDDFGHGTHVAGIVGGNGFDTNGVRTAIAPGANIIALKALDSQGHSTISTIIAAIDYAVAHKNEFNIRVINLSLGAGVYESYETDPLTLATKRAVDAGIVVVAAAGNLGKARDGQPQYGAITAPGNAPWVITVGASSTNGTARRQDDTMALFSSRGPTMIDYIAKPDLVAPGMGTVSLADPLSTFFTTKAQYLLPGFIATPQLPYLALSGTSMSAPVVSGTVALMLQANPNLTPNLVKGILQFTAQTYPGYDPLTQGTGFLNARGAVVLSEYFHNAHRGSAYPTMTGWSKTIFWGNHRVRGGVLTPGGTAWATNVVWGENGDDNVVWGENCVDDTCEGVVWGANPVWGADDGDNVVWGSDGDDNVVWGNTDDDNVVWGSDDNGNVVWGNGDDDNVVWGSDGDDNVVWGSDCGGNDCDNVVWGSTDADNVVWGATDGDDNVVWGSDDGDNVVWGSSDDDNIVWGSSDDDNVVWGSDGDDNVVWGSDGDDNVVWGSSTDVAPILGDERRDLATLPSSMWDALFPLDAIMPVTDNDLPPADDTLPTVDDLLPPVDNSLPPVDDSLPTVDNSLPPPPGGDDVVAPVIDNNPPPPTGGDVLPTVGDTLPPTELPPPPPQDPPSDPTLPTIGGLL